MFRPRNSTIKKNKLLNKTNKTKLQYENYEICKGISLQIINSRVEKAKKDIYGNFIYEVNYMFV